MSIAYIAMCIFIVGLILFKSPTENPRKEYKRTVKIEPPKKKVPTFKE